MSVLAAPKVVCSLHKTHGTPAPLTVELHHVIPVGFQAHYKPAVAPYPGMDQAGRGALWDARTVPICPTGHRNVHHWIVELMKALAGGEDPAVAIAAVQAANRLARGAQFTCASGALLRFKQSGGSLQALLAAHEYGQI